MVGEDVVVLDFSVFADKHELNVKELELDSVRLAREYEERQVMSSVNVGTKFAVSA